MSARSEDASIDGAQPPDAQADTRASQRGYRWFAPFYDLVFGAGLHHGRRLAIEALDCRPGERVLEVGVGSGLALPLYPRDVQVTGLDTSREMLRLAARRIERHRMSESVSLVRTDAGHLGFGDDTFDKAVVMFTASGLPDPVGAMAELKRVCRPGATIVVASHFRSRRPLLRLCDTLLAPMYRPLRYRTDLDLGAFVSAAELEIIDSVPANLFGYSTVLTCRSRA